MTIDARAVKSRRWWYCDDCRTGIQPGKIYVLLYGAGMRLCLVDGTRELARVLARRARKAGMGAAST